MATTAQVMNHWLLKSDPDEYGYDDLERDGRAVWEGVRNPQALGFLRKMARGDLVLIYHTGDDKRIVGLAEVTRGAYPDPRQKDAKLVVIDVNPVRRAPMSVTLAQIKAEKSLAGFALVRQSRLSVMPVSASCWKKLCALSGL